MNETAITAKQRVAEAAAALVEPGMRLGLGSGSTALAFVSALGVRMANGLSLPPAVATSNATATRAAEVGIALADMMAADAPTALDLGVDGADEVDGALRLIKGGGASLLREKIAARMATRFVIIVDAAKLVDTLGRFALPVEVVPFGWAGTAARIANRLDICPVLRLEDGAPVVTDNGNFLLDLPLGSIAAPEAVAATLAGLPGVVEHGLFLTEADEVLVATADGVVRRSRA